jgi:TPR repeat protein
MYNLGRGVRQDSAKAVKWWRKAAEQCNPEAQYLLNIMYGPGKGSPRANGFKLKPVHADADRQDSAAERKITENECLTGDKVTKPGPR